jgi:hypothetical protein
MRIIKEKTGLVAFDIGVNECFDTMSEGERCHMANKLYKEGVVPIKQQQADEVSLREFTTVDEACDFWKDTAIELGYEE